MYSITRFSLCAAVLAVIVFYLARLNEHAEVGSATSAEFAIASGMETASSANSKSRTPTVEKVEKRKTPFQTISLDSTQVTELTALSARDVIWLDAALFPKTSDVDKAKSLPIAELRALSKGQPGLSAVLGRRLVEQGDLVEGIKILRRSMIDGSIFGAEQLGQVYCLRHLDGGPGSQGALAEAIAWWMVAIRAGDYFAGEQLSRCVRDPLKPALLSDATLRSFVLWDEINGERKNMGLPPLAQNLRPSYNEYAKGQLEGTTQMFER